MNHQRHIPTLVLVFAFVLTIATSSGCTSSSVQAMPYSTFVTEIKAGNVQSVTIYDDHAEVTFKNSPQGIDLSELIFHVHVPPADEEKAELLHLLEEHSVVFSYSD